MPNASLEDQWVALCPAPTLQPGWLKWSYKELKFPSAYASGPLEHINLPTTYEVEILRKAMIETEFQNQKSVVFNILWPQFN